MHVSRVLGFFAASAVGVLACQKEDAHPPFLALQCGRNCITGGQQGGDPKKDGGSSDATGDGSAAFQGSVLYFTETSFDPGRALAYNGPGEVTLFGTPSVTGSFVDGTYSLTAGPSGVIWALARPSASDGGTVSLQTLPTFLQVSSAFADLILLPTNLLTEIYAGLTLPTTVDASRAQILLLFKHADDSLVSGITVTAPPGSTVAYGTGSGYSDLQTATGSSGIALLINADAVPLPGADLPIAYVHGDGGTPGTASARAARGTATLLLVTVPP